MSATPVAGEESSERDVALSYDECFDLLSNHRRRYILHYLQQYEAETTIRDLTEQIAAWENEIPVKDISYDQRKRVYTSLQQVHLPRMDDAEVVEYDERSGTVEAGPVAENLDIYLDVAEGEPSPWGYLYFGLAVMNAGVVGVFAAGVWPVAVLPGLGLPLFVTVSFLVASLAHLYVGRTERQSSDGAKPPNTGR